MNKQPSLFELPTAIFSGKFNEYLGILRICGLADLYDVGNTWPVPLFSRRWPKEGKYRDIVGAKSEVLLSEKLLYLDLQPDGKWQLRDCELQFSNPEDRKRYQVGIVVGKLGTSQGLRLRDPIHYDQKAFRQVANAWLRLDPATHPHSADIKTV